MDAIMRDAIKLARELEQMASCFKASAAAAKDRVHKEMHLLDAKNCEQGAAMLQKLGTEVTRLREGIECLHYGRLGANNLWRMSQGWNGDAALVDENRD